MASTTPPRFHIGDAVYLRESALLGFVESYKIDGVEFNTRANQWAYKIVIRQRGPSTNTIIDRVDLSEKLRHITFFEAELIEYCEALDLAIQNTEERLARLRANRARCDTGTDNTEGQYEPRGGVINQPNQ